MAVTPKKTLTWKQKKWYAVIAPNFLNNIQAAEVTAYEDDKLINRIIDIPLKELTKDMGHIYTTIRLRVTDIEGKKANTKFIGHSVAREYMRTLVRRRRDVVDAVFDAVSKDGVEFRIKTTAVSEFRCSEAQKKAIRKAITMELAKRANAQNFGDFVREVIFGHSAQDLQKILHTITPVRKVEVWKTELKELFDTEEKLDVPQSEEPQYERRPRRQETQQPAQEEPAQQQEETPQAQETEERAEAQAAPA
ncbi:hypothetical protein HY995_02145 [Candidatus Micrarchaeota archaeon]|nr:hypothetical protein [Candidatus Micrarchaeota archaeon]